MDGELRPNRSRAFGVALDGSELLALLSLLSRLVTPGEGPLDGGELLGLRPLLNRLAKPGEDEDLLNGDPDLPGLPSLSNRLVTPG